MDVDVSFPRAHHETADGSRIMVADSLSFYEHDTWFRDVAVGASFSGEPTGAMVMRGGARGWIGHQGGPGLASAGSEGLRLADSVGVPAVAIASMTARLADGESLLRGAVGEVNDAAKRLGVEAGESGESAAFKLLAAPEGTVHDFSDRIDESVHEIETSAGVAAAVWSFSRVRPEHTYPVYCVASHGAVTMAYYAVKAGPRGLICNDAGMGLDRSGVSGLTVLEGFGIAAASVSGDTARIGDALSTYHDGVLSAVNVPALNAGLRIGMTAKEATELLLRVRNDG